ncbi:MAG TPA: DAK2 domain-containing protein [Acidimicrobiales bacterium]|nr:DAK2 domain-containing protein [Acidimicrobiales bacterium]
MPVEVLERLAPGDLVAAVTRYRDALRDNRDAINRLNVYPVPDGDTGTNMALTMDSAVAELGNLDGAVGDMAEVCRAISHGSLMGARGNSGVILCQVLRGLADQFVAADAVGPDELASGLTGASDAAYKAVMRPVEGTVLTVVRESAEAAAGARAGGASLVEVLDAARAAGVGALERTPELLPVLKQAGVVDAGGAGMLLLLDALLAVTAGRDVQLAAPVPTSGVGAEARGGNAAVAGSGSGGDGSEDISGLRYEVMYLLEAADEAIPAFREVWAGIGDSIVVVGGGGLWNCHIHTDDIGAAVEAALDVGRPRQIRVTDLLEQVEEERWVRDAVGVSDEDDELRPGEPATTAVVAVATGGGLRRIFRSLGVHQIVAGGQSMNPSTAQILEAVESAPAHQVVVLPNNKNIVPVAEQVRLLTSKDVRVVPTTGIPEGFAALMAYDPQAGADENARAMEEASERVVSGEVTRAVRPSLADVGMIEAGDWLGISPTGIEVVAADAEAAAQALLEKLVDDKHEIVCIIEGAGASAADTRRLTEWLAEHHPRVTAEVHHGGQPLYPYLFSIE